MRRRQPQVVARGERQTLPERTGLPGLRGTAFVVICGKKQQTGIGLGNLREFDQ